LFLTDAVVHHASLTTLDLHVLEWLHARNTRLGLDIAQAISFMGSPPVLSVLAVIVAIRPVRTASPTTTWAG